jgi:rhamnosyltransferase
MAGGGNGLVERSALSKPSRHGTLAQTRATGLARLGGLAVKSGVPHRIAATVVVYRPERDLLLGLVGAVAAEVERIFLFLNRRPDPQLLAECVAAAGPTPVECLGDGSNVGLGRAYNDAARAARAAGCDLLLLFDEDSTPQRGMPARLAAAFDRAGDHVALIGPHPHTVGIAGGYKLPPAAENPALLPPDLRDLAFLISSGSLIDLAAFAEIGPFREDFFIDGIDIEWCFRARSRGFRAVMAMDEAMPHRLGRGIIRVPLLNVHFVDNTPARLLTYARNQAAMMRLPHVPAWWKLRAAAAIAIHLAFSILRGFRGREVAAILRGVNDGLRHRLGPPADAAGRHPV